MPPPAELDQPKVPQHLELLPDLVAHVPIVAAQSGEVSLEDAHAAQ